MRQIVRLVEDAEKLPWDQNDLSRILFGVHIRSTEGDVYAVAMNAIGPRPLQTAPEEYGEFGS